MTNSSKLAKFGFTARPLKRSRRLGLTFFLANFGAKPQNQWIEQGPISLLHALNARPD
jgi:hypothetical protein